MRFNREVLSRGLRDGTPIRTMPNRAVGKTTAAVFAAIAKSYGQPGEWVRVEDPDDDTHSKRRHIVEQVCATLARLDLRAIEVQERRCAAPPVDRIFVDPRDTQYMRAACFDGVFIRNTFSESV